MNPVAIKIDAAANLYVLDNATGKVIKDPITGKVQKPAGWTKPNMKQFVE